MEILTKFTILMGPFLMNSLYGWVLFYPVTDYVYYIDGYIFLVERGTCIPTFGQTPRDRPEDKC